MRILYLVFVLGCLFVSGCATAPKDYTAFRAHRPKSIIVLPPQNETNDIIAGYSLLTTTTRPLAELGYYVFPVMLVDQFLKENGLPTAAEMHQAPLAKLREVFGADAVLYITVEKYGSKYMVVAADTFVFARAKLVDCRTGAVLWEDRVQAHGGGNSGIIEALVAQVVNKLADVAHPVAAQASWMLFTTPKKGLLKGPRHSEFGN